MNIARKLAILFLCSSVAVWADGNSFKKIRYDGGSVNLKIDALDWENLLTVTKDMITLVMQDGTKLEIAPRSVISLSYGQEACRLIGGMIGLSKHKKQAHFIGIQYATQDKRAENILLEGDKGNYRAILRALYNVTLVPVYVDKRQRDLIPAGIALHETIESTRRGSRFEEITDPNVLREFEILPATVNISSKPTRAEVSVDGKVVGKAPVVIKLDFGEHTLTIRMDSYKDWSKTIFVSPGLKMQVEADLEK